MRFNKLDLNLLVAFDALVAECSITRAAARLNLTPSATSSALARLRSYFEDELLVQVGASGINRPDVLQRKGAYAPPPGASDLPGLEIAGTIVGGDAAPRKVGNRPTHRHAAQRHSSMTSAGGPKPDTLVTARSSTPSGVSTSTSTIQAAT